ncbi:aldo-keto reductase family 1 member C13, partial [Sigmodon hispidus]
FHGVGSLLQALLSLVSSLFLMLGFNHKMIFKIPENKPLEAINLAPEAGFCHFDTAYVYQTEKDLGQAIQSKIAAGTIKREDIFITTKLWCTFLRPELVCSNLEKLFKNLKLDYVDLFIIHYPFAMKPGEDLFPEDGHGKTLLDTVDICATWEVSSRKRNNGEAGRGKCSGKSGTVYVNDRLIGMETSWAWLTEKDSGSRPSREGTRTGSRHSLTRVPGPSAQFAPAAREFGCTAWR